MSDIATRSPDTEPAPRTHVELDHWFFKKVEGIRFQNHQTTGQAGVTITMAKNEAFLTLASLRKEFQIEPGTLDGQMLNLVSDGLKYVKGLLIGDELPKEILTGEASWKLTPTHLAIAHQRVAMRLITLVSTDEPTTTDPAELLALADDPSIKKKINESFEVAAIELGMRREQKEEVIEFVNTLAAELGYIEFLREKFQRIDAMRERIQKVRVLHSRTASIRESSDQVARLIERAVKEYQAMFDEIDEHTSAVVPLLREIDDSIEYIRKMRDDLHVRFLAWDDLLAEWEPRLVEYSFKVNDLLRTTHQFLAPRFMSFTDWTAIAREEQKKRARLRVQPMAW
ncbi:MAG TPA: hypothetical protein VKP60_17040 [Magnetospirillaceae bacterium]|nr:hypothetical protein [Magnetospirillaceae bacterium]